MESDFEYKKRVVDDELSLQLEAAGIVLVEGPKWCGKTTTSLQQAQSVIYLDDPQEVSEYALLAEMDIQQLLKGQNPRLLDEWQNFPQLWDACRFVVDRSNKDGLFILTGSTRLKKKNLVSHTGTGRVGRIKMRPMSLWESGESSGCISLGQLFKEPFKAGDIVKLRHPENYIKADDIYGYWINLYKIISIKVDDVKLEGVQEIVPIGELHHAEARGHSVLAAVVVHVHGEAFAVVHVQGNVNHFSFSGIVIGGSFLFLALAHSKHESQSHDDCAKSFHFNHFVFSCFPDFYVFLKMRRPRQPLP